MWSFGTLFRNISNNLRDNKDGFGGKEIEIEFGRAGRL